MTRTPLSADNAAVVLIDHAIGFSPLIGSRPIEETVSGAVALAKIAKLFGAPLVATNGRDEAPSGPLYPELQEALGDHPVIARDEGFDAFYDENFAAAIEATERRRLIMAGVQTDVCLTQTALTAIDRGYEVYVVVDASAAPNKEIHDTAVMRLVQAGAIPTNWLAIGSELQRSWTEQETAPGFAKLLYEQLTSWGHLHALAENVQKFAAKSGQ